MLTSDVHVTYKTDDNIRLSSITDCRISDENEKTPDCTE